MPPPTSRPVASFSNLGKLPSTKVRRSPYKDFLQPTLQRRFASTVLVLLAVSYVESLVLSSWNSPIQSWFPIGIAGIRALAIAASALFVVILRIAHPHFGIRTTDSPLDTFRQHAFRAHTIEVLCTYMVSGFLFSQVYLFAVGDAAILQWIIKHSGDRARLNERALFFTVSITWLGAWKGFRHLVDDLDRVNLGGVKTIGVNGPAPPHSRADEPLEKLIKLTPRIILQAISTSCIFACMMYLVGYRVRRDLVWWIAMTWFRNFYSLPRSNIPPSTSPWSAWMLLRTMAAGIMLCTLWDLGNAVFTLQLSKEPLKNGRPLTSQSEKDKKDKRGVLKDPNGSLLNGLKSKKPRIASFSMWELALIARDFEARRKSIFEDIDRKEGPMWSQIYMICLDKVKELEKRADAYLKLEEEKPEGVRPREKAKEQEKKLKLLSEEPLKANIYTRPQAKGGLEKYVAGIANSPGKKFSDSLGPLARKGFEGAKDSLLTKQQQDQLANTGIIGSFHWLLPYALQLPSAGDFIRQYFHRRFARIVLGTPYGDVSIYVNAAFAVSQLAVASLVEDKYGNVHRDVPAIIRTFTTIIKKLEKLREELPIHWTDPNGDRNCEPVDEVIDALKDGLLRVVDAFQQYSSDLRLTRADLRLAREAAEKPQQQQQQQQPPQPQPQPQSQGQRMTGRGDINNNAGQQQPAPAVEGGGGNTAADAGQAQPEMRQIR